MVRGKLLMRQGPRTNWLVRISELFEARFYRDWGHSARLFDLIVGLHDTLQANPKNCGEPHPAWKDGSVWIWESPNLIGMPRVVVLNTMDANNQDRGDVQFSDFFLTPTVGRDTKLTECARALVKLTA